MLTVTYKQLFNVLLLIKTMILRTYFMEQSPSWAANQFSASQEISRILGNPKVHYRIHKCPPSVPNKTIILVFIILYTHFVMHWSTARVYLYPEPHLQIAI